MYNKEEFKNELQEMLVEMFPDRDSSLISVTEPLHTTLFCI